MRDVGDEIAPHLLQLADPSNVRRQQQPLLLAVRHDAGTEQHVVIHRRGKLHAVALAALRQERHETRMAHQVRDRQTDIPVRRQAEQGVSGAVAPQHPVVFAQHHGGVRQRGGGLLKLFQQPTELAFALAALPTQARDMGTDIRPHQPAERHRTTIPTLAQPALQLSQLPHLPSQTTQCGQQQSPQRMTHQPAGPCGAQQDQSLPSQQRPPGTGHTRSESKTDSRRRAPFGSSPRSRGAPIPCAAAGYAHPRCVPRHRRCCPIRDPATGHDCKPAPDGT